MGEAKLAINNLFSRISGKNRGDDSDMKPNNSSGPMVSKNPSDPSAPSDQAAVKSDSTNAERTIADKLNAIQNRIMDMSAVVQKVEQFMAKERDKSKS